MARGNEEFEMAPRPVEIFDLRVIKITLPEVHVRVHCSKGTYIRALARDLGMKLGVGALASSIKRIKSGEFCLTDAIAFDSLDAENLKPALRIGKDAVGGITTIDLDKENMIHAQHGRTFAVAEPFLGHAFGFYRDEPIALLEGQPNGIIRVARGF
ncbi:MAG: tRNA pseudouridine synthase B [bacterium ADurb.BinA186]|nr:MAG: tRNA pseudouridine synthase B [bacterium ADurb.BinA186]